MLVHMQLNLEALYRTLVGLFIVRRLGVRIA